MRTTLLIAAAIAALAPVAAEAHARLVASTPAADAVAAPTTPIALHFSERLVARLSGATLADATHPGAIAAATKPGADGKSLMLMPAQPLAPGTYRVEYHVVSADTHRVAGALSFQVK